MHGIIICSRKDVSPVCQNAGEQGKMNMRGLNALFVASGSVGRTQQHIKVMYDGVHTTSC